MLAWPKVHMQDGGLGSSMYMLECEMVATLQVHWGSKANYAVEGGAANTDTGAAGFSSGL